MFNADDLLAASSEVAASDLAEARTLFATARKRMAVAFAFLPRLRVPPPLLPLLLPPPDAIS